MQFDPLDTLIDALDAVAPAHDNSHDGHFDVASMQADHTALCELVATVTARPRDPDRVRRLQAEPRIQRAVENMRPRTG